MRTAVLASIMSLSFSTGCFTPIIDLGSLGRVSPLEEVVISGDAVHKIALLEVSGVIAFEASNTWEFGGQKPSVISRLHEALDLAASDPQVKGLVLRVRSPGGGVAPSETLHHLITLWKAQTEKPVVAFLQGIAASGGYYIAVAADHIVAHPSSVTGSIGVIMPGFNVADLMDRFGVVDQTLTSGPFKDSGSMTRAMRDDEREQLQSVISDLYARFVDVVDEGRPKLDRFAVERLADGRIFTSNQALKAGLVDEVGHMDVAVNSLMHLANLSTAMLVTYKQVGETVNNVYSDLSSRISTKTEINLFNVGGSNVPVGFYYLWPMALPR